MARPHRQKECWWSVAAGSCPTSGCRENTSSTHRQPPVLRLPAAHGGISSAVVLRDNLAGQDCRRLRVVKLHCYLQMQQCDYPRCSAAGTTIPVLWSPNSHQHPFACTIIAREQSKRASSSAEGRQDFFSSEGSCAVTGSCWSCEEFAETCAMRGMTTLRTSFVVSESRLAKVSQQAKCRCLLGAVSVVLPRLAPFVVRRAACFPRAYSADIRPCACAKHLPGPR